MDWINNLTRDFLYFSFIEAIIFCYYFYKFGKCDRFKFYDFVIIGFTNCLISQIFPPMFYQLVMIVFMGCYIYMTKDKSIFKGMLLSLSAMIFVLIVEMIMAMFYETCFGINFIELSYIETFLAIIPMKILEILIINKGGVLLMKAWFGEIKKK